MAEGYESIGTALAAVTAVAPATYNGLTLTLPANWSHREIFSKESESIWEIGVTYADPNQGGVIPGTKVQLSFDYAPTTATVYATPAGTATSTTTGIVSTIGGLAANKYGGYIGVGQDGSVQGVEVEVLGLTITATYTVAKADYDESFVDAVKALGTPQTKVNSSSVTMNIGTADEPNLVDFAARELRFRGLTSTQQANGDWLCTAQFVLSTSADVVVTFCNTNVESLPRETGTITIPPHDVIWFPPTAKPQTGELVTLPAGAYVHRIYPGASFNGLLIPSN